MITLENYEIFVDKRQSKSGSTYYALYIKLADKDILLKFLKQSEYEYIVSLSK